MGYEIYIDVCECVYAHAYIYETESIHRDASTYIASPLTHKTRTSKKHTSVFQKFCTLGISLKNQLFLMQSVQKCCLKTKRQDIALF